MTQKGRKTARGDSAHRALEGIRVIEIAQWAAVPGAASILAEFGADVIHIEHPVRGDASRGTVVTRAAAPFNYSWEQDNHNKRSIGVDVGKEDGRQIICDLVKSADVFLSNFRPHELKRYCLEYRQLKKINPRIIYTILTGYGRKGPEKETPGYDVTSFWARSGIMLTLVEPGASLPFCRPGLGDRSVSLSIAGAISLALFVRERTGIGQEVDLSLFGNGIWVMGRDIQASLITKRPAVQPPQEEAQNPLFNYYRCKDSKYVLVCHPRPDPFWPAFCKAIEREDLEHDERFTTQIKRMENNKALIPMIDKAFAARTRKQMGKRLQECGLVWAPVQNTAEVVADRQARAGGSFVELDHPKYGAIEMLINPWKLSKTPASISTPGPELGQHTEEIMLELGYSKANIVKLREQKTIN